MYYYILLRVIHNINMLILSLHLSCKNRFLCWTVALDKRGYQVTFLSASTMLSPLCVQLHFSNTKASRLLKHYENTPIQVTENFTAKKQKFSDKKFWYFSYFCSKHRLPPQWGGSNGYPQSVFLSRNKKK